MAETTMVRRHAAYWERLSPTTFMDSQFDNREIVRRSLSERAISPIVSSLALMRLIAMRLSEFVFHRARTCYFPCYQGIEKPRLDHADAEEMPMTETPDPDITVQGIHALARLE